MTVRTAAHPGPDTLAAFNRGALPPVERTSVEAHVATCDSCCAALAALSEDRLVSLARQAAADLPPTADSLLIPDVPPELIDHPRYQVLGQLGAGGMGVVYKAQHRLMDRVVALKVVSRRYTSSPGAVERFRREVRAAARLDHANIVRAHDAEESNGLHFLVMECVEGISLDRLVARRGPLPVATACQCVRQAAIGLQHAHERGMVHRDIKPHNLMVTRKGQLKVLDFGLARLAAEADPPVRTDATSLTDAAVTTPSLVLGTPDYLAPEQAKNAHGVDIRADIYSLGCVLYFLLTGRPPFAGFGGGIEKMLAHVQDPPRPVRELRPEVPAGLADVLDRMLAKDPAARYATPAEVAAAVKPFTKAGALIDEQPDIVEPPLVPVPAAPTMAVNRIDTDVAPRRPTLRRKRPKHRRRRPWRVLIGGAIAGVAALAVGLILAFGGKPRAADGPAGPLTGLATAGPGKRILFIIPHRGFSYTDYQPARDRLREAGYEVVTASTATTPALSWSKVRGPEVRPDKRVADIDPSDYTAVLFCGANHAEYTTAAEPATYAAVKRVIEEMRVAPRCVGAIGDGQHILKHFGVITKGRVAGAGWEGRVVTAGWGHPEEFASEVLAALASPAR